MEPKIIHVTIDVPESISPEAGAVAAMKAREAAVLALWEAGEISSSRAAVELELSAHDFLDLLAAEGLSVVREYDSSIVDELAPPLETTKRP